MNSNSIIQGNCFDVLERLPDDCIDLVLTSPPYDQIRHYGGKVADVIDYDHLGELLYSKTKEGGVVVVVLQDSKTGGARSGVSFNAVLSFLSCGFRLFETLIYYRHGSPTGSHGKDMIGFRLDHEYIFVFFKGKKLSYFDKSSLLVTTVTKGASRNSIVTRRPDGSFKDRTKVIVTGEFKCRGSVWCYSTGGSQGVKSKHPATFPDLLAEEIVRCFSVDKCLVVDPFAGSGTTCLAAAKLGRYFIGMELVSEYIDIIQQRFESEFTKTLFGVPVEVRRKRIRRKRPN